MPSGASSFVTSCVIVLPSARYTDPVPVVPGESVQKSAEPPSVTSARGADPAMMPLGVPPAGPTDLSAPVVPLIPPSVQ